jgi:Mn2+/Fe2+ NRAMP family transporter
VLGLAVFNGLFLAAAIMARQHWGQAARSLATLSPFPGGSLNTLLLVASTIGVTVTPWMVFFHSPAPGTDLHYSQHRGTTMTRAGNVTDAGSRLRSEESQKSSRT